MRSISIVYKKSRRQVPQDLRSSPTIRRSVDEYYANLMEKEKNKQLHQMRKKEIIERMKLKTSKAHRQSDKYQILDSINIMQVQRKSIQQQKQVQTIKRKERTFSIKRLQSSKFIIKGIFDRQKIMEEDDANSDNSQRIVHSKLKNLYSIKKNKQIKEVVVVLSVDFILNEMNFWEDEEIDDMCVKFWKTLQTQSNIVWVCVRENTCRKLVKFAATYNLRLDSVYQILPRKKAQSLTISYQNIQSEYNIRNDYVNSSISNKSASKKLIIINGIRVQSIKNLQFSQFINMIPIVKVSQCAVHFVKIDVNDKNRLNDALKVLSTEKYPEPFNINKLFKEIKSHNQSLKKQSNNEKQFMISSSKCILEENLYQKLQELKKKLIKHFTHGISTFNEKIKYQQSQFSIQYIIGDMLKRNQRSFSQYADYARKFEERIGKSQAQSDQYLREYSTQPVRGKKKIIERQFIYRNPVYIWQF